MAGDAYKHAVEIETNLRIVSSANLEEDLRAITARVAKATINADNFAHLIDQIEDRVKGAIDPSTGARLDSGSANDSPRDDKKKKEQEHRRQARLRAKEVSKEEE